MKNIKIRSSNGNKFIIKNDTSININSSLDPHPKNQLIELINTTKVDSALLLGHSSMADACMRVIEGDGSESKMCGNGIITVVNELHQSNKETSKVEYNIETLSGIINAKVNSLGEVNVEMGIFEDMKMAKIFGLDTYFTNIGEPHAITFIDEIDKADNIFKDLGKKFVNTKLRFGDYISNFNFNLAEIREDKVFLRTFERGVNDETLSCGTGSTCVGSLVSKLTNNTKNIIVQTLGGEFVIKNKGQKSNLSSRISAGL